MKIIIFHNVPFFFLFLFFLFLSIFSMYIHNILLTLSNMNFYFKSCFNMKSKQTQLVYMMLNHIYIYILYRGVCIIYDKYIITMFYFSHSLFDRKSYFLSFVCWVFRYTLKISQIDWML